MSLITRSRRPVQLLGRAMLAVATALSMLAVASVVSAPAAAAAVVPPVVGPAAGHVTADPLPTVQVNGVVWDQVIVGNTVYVVGDFSQARPAGSAPGTNQTPRANMLAYNLTTGALIPGFVANLNSQGKTVVASPDGSRIYVGGQFTTVNGVSRLRLAALNPTTGAVLTSFNASTDYIVNDLAVTNTTVYAGGPFSKAKGVARSRLAAFSASDGALLPWAPVADHTVQTILLTPDGSRVIAGGNFLNLNGVGAYGMGALDPTTGATLPWAANQVVQNGGSYDGAILDLSTDGTSVFGNGFTFGRTTGNLEGVFKANATTGAIVWVEDCHGDTYSAFPMNGYVYKAGHTHFCSNTGGNPQSDNTHTQWGEYQHHSMSFKDGVAGTLRRDQWSYHNLEGLPAPSPTSWAPDWQVGSYTGSTQAAWDVTGNAQYISYGGEFPSVNNVNQQGLVRFAVRPIAPGNQGPRLSGAAFPINVESPSAGQVRITFPANIDRDDASLTYQIRRDGTTVHTTTADSAYWDQPTVSFVDTGRTPGQSHSYQVRASDPDGNVQLSSAVSVVVASSGAPPNYANRVLADGARIYWRLGDDPGSTSAQDSAGVDTGAVNAMTFGRPGAIVGDSDTAVTPTGTSSRIVQPPLVNSQGLNERNPVVDELTVEAWFRTTSSQGGRLLGFGNSNNGTSSSGTHDRVLYVNNSGQVLFGVRTRPEGTGTSSARQNRTVQSASGLNNGAWHHVVGTLNPDGMRLYVDGQLAASRGDTNSGHGYYGYWRVGADSLSGWPNTPSSTRLNGDIDEAAVYHRALTSSEVSNHWVLSGRGGGNVTPSAAFGWSASGLTATFDASASGDVDGNIQTYAWNFGDGSTGSGVNPQHTYTSGGSRTVTLTVTDDDGGTGVMSQTVTVTAPAANLPPQASFSFGTNGLGVSVDSTGSVDTDGFIVSRAWTFGDGGTASGVTASHTYAAGNTYTVTLTVTDDDGATGTSSQQVTVSDPGGDVELALDDFTRTTANGWGSAPLGGPWAVTGTASSYSVNGSAGRIAVGIGQTRSASVATGTAADVDTVMDVSLEQSPTGGGIYLSSVARKVGTSEYRLRVKLQPTTTNLQLNRVVNGVTTVFASVTIPEVYTAGSVMHVRFRVTGAATTALSGKVWFDGASEPAGWTIQGTDSSGALQDPGRVGVDAYVSGTTAAAMTLLVDRVRSILAVP